MTKIKNDDPNMKGENNTCIDCHSRIEQAGF